MIRAALRSNAFEMRELIKMADNKRITSAATPNSSSTCVMSDAAKPDDDRRLRNAVEDLRNQLKEIEGLSELVALIPRDIDALCTQVELFDTLALVEPLIDSMGVRSKEWGAIRDSIATLSVHPRRRKAKVSLNMALVEDFVENGLYPVARGRVKPFLEKLALVKLTRDEWLDLITSIETIYEEVVYDSLEADASEEEELAAKEDALLVDAKLLECAGDDSSWCSKHGKQNCPPIEKKGICPGTTTL